MNIELIKAIDLIPEHLQYWYKDPTMNPSLLSGVFNRGKDSTDYEWEMFSILYLTRLWFWYGGYIFLSRVVQPLLPNVIT